MKIKVCGINYKNQLRQLLLSKIDMIGLNFYSKSKRYVIDDSLADIDTSGLEIVGVFVDESVDKIKRIHDSYQFSYIQCHGHESVDKCKKIQDIQKIIKVFSISDEKDLAETQRFEFADYFLFDTKTKDYGGSGQKFDWNILHNYNGDVPFLIAGGIGPVDIDSIKQISHPQFAGVDINSKFEIRAGFKDLSLVERFTKKLKNNI